MPSDEYRDLQEAARDALRELLRATEPGTGLYLHRTYATLKESIESDGLGSGDHSAPPQPDRVPHWVDKTTVREREHEVLSAFGDRRLTISQIRDEIAQKHSPDLSVWRSNVVSVVGRLQKSGDLSRVKAPHPDGGRRAPVWHYFPNTDLEGPIADLQKQFDEEAN